MTSEGRKDDAATLEPPMDLAEVARQDWIHEAPTRRPADSVTNEDEARPAATASGDAFLDKIPTLLVSKDAIPWLVADPNAEQLLAAIDGHSTVRMLLTITGLSQSEAATLLQRLADEGTIAIS
jgi:hypothetical protein